MIRVYNSVNISFLYNNGIKVLNPLFAEITKVDNGDYYIEIEDTLDNFEYYQKGMVLGVDTPSSWSLDGKGKIQCFRCDNPRIENNRVYCKAWHLFYDSKNYVIAGHLARNSGTCNEVMIDCKNNVNDAKECPFSSGATISSNITGEKETEIEAMSLYDSFVYLTNVYGGRWVRDNFNFSINEKTLKESGVVLAYNKNITDMKVEENWDNVCTKVMPYTMVGDTKITLQNPPNNISYYLGLKDIGEDNPYEEDRLQFTKVVEFKYQEKDGESAPTSASKWREWLRSEAEKYLRANKLPQVNYSVSANIDNISDVGDVIRVKHPKCNVDIYTEVISVKYDAIMQKYTEIEFGNFRRAFKNIFTETVSNAVAKTSETVKSVFNDSAFGIESFNFYTNDGDCLQVGSVVNSSEHKLRIRQKSKDSDTWGAWRIIQEGAGASKEVVLFNSIGSYNKVTLNQSINNTDYSAIEIFYGIFTTGYDGSTFDHYQSVKVSVPVGKKVSLVSSAIDSNDGITIGVGIVEIASDVITFKKNNAYKGSNMASTSNKNLVYIRKVIGYKV